jgi:hypothetical protein
MVDFEDIEVELFLVKTLQKLTEVEHILLDMLQKIL